MCASLTSCSISTRWVSPPFSEPLAGIDVPITPHQVYAVLDEVFLAGEIEETSKAVILSRLEYLESLP